MPHVNTITGNDLKQLSAPVLRSVVASGTTYIPTDDITVILGANATITIGGQSIDLLQGSTFVMVEGLTYTFAVSTQLGIS